MVSPIFHRLHLCLSIVTTSVGLIVNSSLPCRGNLYAVSGVREKLTLAKGCKMKAVVVAADDKSSLLNGFGDLAIKGASNIFQLLSLTLNGEEATAIIHAHMHT